ncbi:MAG: ABC transporter substrate-binding protein [Mastigocoleus sp. MO_188.B34]|nr:ABC transporter substrate-binding protein [Mastigocoleus sp. MO_188.B34]
MSCCLNPNCSHPNDPMNADRKFCRNCGSSLLLNQRYRITKRLGKGGFSRTFEVEYENSYYVLKVLNLSPFTEKVRHKVVDLFKREASVLQFLNHPGIPKVHENGYFELKFPNYPEPLYCLVMEKVDGLNLQEWLDRQGEKPLPFEEIYKSFKQLVEILDLVHERGYFHRDIKPANIMLRPDGQLVLIDFGAVRDLAQTYLQHDDIRSGTQIGSPGYAPQEQIHYGETVAQSDIFALGRTFVHLLTRLHPLDIPIDKNGKLTWRDKVLLPSQTEKNVIDKLRWHNFQNLLDATLEIDWRRRPKDTKVILRHLNKKLILHFIPYKVIAIFLLLGIGLFTSNWYLNGVNGCSKIAYRNFPIGDELSCGEEILFTNRWDTKKREGVAAIAKGDYINGVRLLEIAWNEERDPETLIYLNNARIKAENLEAYTIAVVAPIINNQDSINSSLEILRGVAQAQDEFNQKNKKQGIGLKVLIASDNNNPIKAQKIAKYLVGKRDILAVIGHFTSDTTIETIDIYQRHKMLLISPTSTSEDLSKKCENIELKNCFFRRVISRDSITAKTLADYLANQLNKRKAVVFYNKNSNYSKSLRNVFNSEFENQAGKIVKEFNLSDRRFNARYAVAQAKKKQAETIVLFPNSDGLASSKALQVITAAEKKILLVGGDGLYHSNTLILVRQNALGLIVAIPWHHSLNPDNGFSVTAEKMWKGKVSWRTATAYDATNTLITALEKLPISANSEDIARVTAEQGFFSIGATGKITFDANGDRSTQPIGEDPKERNIHLVKVVRNSSGQLEFTPLLGIGD